jgi:O-antigen ligase
MLSAVTSPGAAMGRNNRLTVLFLVAAGLAGASACFILLRFRRPGFASLGTISFGLGWLDLVLSALLVSALNKKRPGPGLFKPGLPDLAFAGTLVVTLASFLAFSRDRSLAYLPLLSVGTFSFYLLVRSVRARLSGPWARRLFAAVSITAGLEAVHGLAQGALGSEMRGLFFNANHLAMFLALALPVSAALALKTANDGNVRPYRMIVPVLIGAIALSGCRTAYLAIIVVAAAAAPAFIKCRPDRRGRSRRGWTIFAGAFLAASAALLGLSFKQVSAAGRVMIWKASVPMLLERPIAGVGVGNFAVYYNIFQARYFEAGHGTPVERLSADSPPYAFNDYLETAVETGAIGFAVNAVFWALVLMSAVAGLREFGRARASGMVPDVLALGSSLSVLAFMVMSFFYYPGRIAPTSFLFAGFFAWTVKDRGLPRRAGPQAGRARTLGLAYALATAAAAVALLPILHGQFVAEREWSEAKFLARRGDLAGGIAKCRTAVRRLAGNAAFLEDFGSLLLESGSPAEAVSVFERAVSLRSSPYGLEKLASARLRLGDLAGARENARLADSILPWRLTSKALLMDILEKLGDARGSARYAGRILETPMKARSDEGLRLKRRALEVWMGAEKSETDSETPILDVLPLVPGAYRLDVLEALHAAGSRAGLFIEAIRGAAAVERPGLSFLLANMPDRDLRSLNIAGFVEDVRLAYEARRTIPLAAAVPEEIFLENVLPYAVANEPRDRWRPEFYRRFREAAAAGSSVEDVVLALNRDVFAAYRLSYLERDDRKDLLSPRQVMERGFVSCGEAALLVVEACRAIGIPARMVILPRWPESKAGHFWLEVFDRDRWRRLTAFDPTPLDRTWIEKLAAKIVPLRPENRIYAVSFRKTPIRIMFGGDVSFLDITGEYIR